MPRTAAARLDRLTAVLATSEPPAAALDPSADAATQPLPVASSPPRRRGRLRWLARWVPPSWREVRIDPGRPGALALVLVAVVAAIVAAVGVWTGRPQAEAVPGLAAVTVSGSESTSPTSRTSTGPASAAPGAGGALVVSVSGRVVRPGLVHVPDGSRVADVLTAAGGALPGVDVGALNLARRVTDGEQIVVGLPAPADPGGAVAAAPTSAAPGAPIDLNTATAAQLDGLPGVGPVTAAHIVDWRTRNGRFSRVEQLREIDGIGEHRFQQLRELVTV